MIHCTRVALLGHGCCLAWLRCSDMAGSAESDCLLQKGAWTAPKTRLPPCCPVACRRKGGKRRGTGVKYDDVAGIDHIKADVKEVCGPVYLCLSRLLVGPCRSSVAVLLPLLAGSAGNA